MSRRYWGDVVTSVAVNATAARVTSRGFQYTPQKNITQVWSDCPLHVKMLSRTQEDLRGRRSGRLTAIGPYVKKKKRWVCRCDCGDYVTRTAK
jgi:hypothetical protein